MLANLARRIFGLEPKAQEGVWDIPSSWYGLGTYAGIPITREQAMRISAVYAAVGIISGAISSMPLMLYRRTANGGKERATDHPLWQTITSKPHSLWNFFEFMETEMQRLLLHGNSYSLKQPMGRGMELRPLDPSSVTVEVDSLGRPSYVVRPQLSRSGEVARYGRDKIFHIKGLSTDGYTGRSVISDAREQMGMSVVIQEHMSRTFKNGAQLKGVVEFANPLVGQARTNFVDSFRKEYEGSENAGKTLVLEGARFRTISMSMTDAQTLEVLKATIGDVARFFQVPLHMLAEAIAQPRANMEQGAKEFDMYTLLRWTRRIEYAYNDQILDDDPNLFVEFLFEERLRTDLAARTASYAQAKLNGWMNADTICARENLPLLPNGTGSEYWQPMNIGTVPGTETRQRQAVILPAPTDQPPPGKQQQLVNGRAH